MLIYKIESQEGLELETHEDFLDCLDSARKIARPIKIYKEADKKRTLLAHRGNKVDGDNIMKGLMLEKRRREAQELT